MVNRTSTAYNRRPTSQGATSGGALVVFTILGLTWLGVYLYNSYHVTPAIIEDDSGIPSAADQETLSFVIGHLHTREQTEAYWDTMKHHTQRKLTNIRDLTPEQYKQIEDTYEPKDE